MKNAFDIIRRPVITEQSMESVADKKYVFMVDVDANKTEIKAAVEQAFGVKVAKVNTIRMQGKVKRTGAYPAGKRAAYKKAVVTLTAPRPSSSSKAWSKPISIKERNANGY